jgi:signal transduction histidine kinase
VSLLLAGALTWVLVRDLEYRGVQDQLDRDVAAAALVVKHEECLNRPVAVTNPGSALCRLDSPSDFEDRLTSGVTALNSNRLLLLNAQRRILFDSGDASTSGMLVDVTASKRVVNVGEARATLGSEAYLAAAVGIAPARDPIGAAYVVLARPEASVAAAAAGDLALSLLEAGGAALILALLLAFLFSRTLTRPLVQLGAAAEDIAAGNYSRRVGIRGDDEIGTLGSAFNGMAEAVERARMIQRDFLANVSHELKTPLTSLIGFSQALVDGSLMSDTERSRAATIVNDESQRVLRLAQELLDLARVEAGSISMHIAAVDLGGQLQQQLEIVKPRAEARHLELAFGWPPDIPPVAADPERLQQVLDNLLDNAVKYAPESSAVSVTARLVEGAVETVVSNPAGEHRPDPDRMFDRFYRADPSRSSSAGGVGLGLAISRELAVAMKGRLWADIDVEGNLRLHLLLPEAR